MIPSKKKCCCDVGVGCLTGAGCSWPAKDLVFSWTSTALHPAGSTPMAFVTNTTWTGWYGVIDSAFPPAGSPLWAPTILDGNVGSCTATYGGSTAKIIVILQCDPITGGLRGSSCMLKSASGQQIEPGTVVVPATGEPYLAPAFDWSSCPSGSRPSFTYGRSTGFLSSETCSPLSVALSFAQGFNRPTGGFYIMSYAGVVTL